MLIYKTIKKHEISKASLKSKIETIVQLAILYKFANLSLYNFAKSINLIIYPY